MKPDKIEDSSNQISENESTQGTVESEVNSASRSIKLLFFFYFFIL